MTRTTAEVPHTIARLRALRPGESMMFYRGRPGTETVGPGPYQDLLRAVFKEAASLEQVGRVTLPTRKARILLPPDKKGRVVRVEVIEHFAVGVGVTS
jgi:hypothetical protein